MFCKDCGAQLADDARFCPHCGSAQAVTPPAQTVTPPAEPENIAVYEDALYAAQTAKRAGFYVIGVYDESAEKNFPELKKISDEIILEW